jgi:hypothetical protein
MNRKRAYDEELLKKETQKARAISKMLPST